MAISLDSLQRGVVIEPPRVVLYGPNKIGKTTFAAQAPNPVFILTEDGIGKLDVPRFPIAQSYDDVIGAIEALAETDHDFETVVLDSADWLEKLIFKKAAQSFGKENIAEVGYGKGYEWAQQLWHDLCDGFDYLRRARGMAVIILSHSLIKSYSAPGQEAYDRFRLDLHDKSASVLQDWADAILFASYDIRVQAADEKKKTKAKAFGQGQRLLYTEERPAHWGGNRYDLPYELPFPKEGAWQVFEEAMQASLPGGKAEEKPAKKKAAKEKEGAGK